MMWLFKDSEAVWKRSLERNRRDPEAAFVCANCAHVPVGGNAIRRFDCCIKPSKAVAA